jgi:hypothetical protein
VRYEQLVEGVEVETLNRDGVIRTLVTFVPSPFWSTLQARTRQTYRDCFEEARHNPQILASQKPDWLLQHRHFRMESVLQAVARDYGLAVSESLIVTNSRRYVLVGCGPMLVTQSYVQTLADVPTPARFRERHSKMNEISASPQLKLGDQPEVLLEKKDFYGIVTHNPIGNQFSEIDQALSMIQFSVPEPGCNDWIAQFTFQEIIAAYKTREEEAPRRDRDVSWKDDRPDSKKDDSGE